MSSWIILDWQHDLFRIAVAQGARRGVQITKAVTWAHPEPLTPSTAASVGKALREFLKSANITAAPVIVGLGRDRIFLKELRFPPIAAHEEASLVRFQTGKEMAESVESYAIDYTHLKNGAADKHVMTVAARRDILNTVQSMCQAAGLKLHAVTPKLFGMALALERAVRPATPLGPKQLNVVLNVGARWAELCFFRGDRLLQAQALANGPLLAAEVKRNLAVFQAQTAVSVDLEAPECLYIFGADESAVEALQMGQPLPVRVIDPLKPEEGVLEDGADFAGAVGLAALWSDTEQRPVNLAAPKRSQAPTSAIQQRGVVYGAMAGVAAVFLIGVMIYVLYAKRQEIARLTAQKADQAQTWDSLAQERAEWDAFREWDNNSISMLDELYDLSARFPYEKDFRVNQFDAIPNSSPKAKGGKEGYVAAISLNGTVPLGKDKFVDQLRGNLLTDGHLKSASGQLTNTKWGANYQVKIDVAKQDVKKFDTHLEKPARPVVTVKGPTKYVTVKKAGRDPALPPEEKKVVEPDDDAEKGGGQ